MSTAVVTIAAGRHAHLSRQHTALAAVGPDTCVVVAMGDARIREVAEHGALGTSHSSPTLSIVEIPADPNQLPLARARNIGAARAVELGAELLIFLDVDCIPGPDLVAAYKRAAHRTVRHEGPTVLCGPVAYLPPPLNTRGAYPADLSVIASPHPARPAPRPGQILRSDDFDLFWSLSFAITAEHWAASGGFDETYVGYGAEDTDFGRTVAGLGGRMFWVGGADAYHQWHPVSDPPIEHLESIVRNANIFQIKWGWTPMTGWLRAFQRSGLAAADANGAWHVSS